MTEVLHYANYLTPTGEAVYNYVNYCGGCRRKLTDHTASGYPEYPEDLDDRTSWAHLRERDFEFWMFCPWCGTAFDEKWWKRPVIRNERVPDHFTNPGTHAGDSHVFDGDYMDGHVLASTEPELCWCKPEVVPGLMGCEVRHRNVSR